MDGSTIPARVSDAPEPFGSSAAAWFWCVGIMEARKLGAGAAFGSGGRRPCTPDDILLVLDRLCRQRRINIEHARILRIYGERGSAPNPSYPPERGHHRLWQEAMVALSGPLRGRGIVR